MLFAYNQLINSLYRRCYTGSIVLAEYKLVYVKYLIKKLIVKWLKIKEKVYYFCIKLKNN